MLALYSAASSAFVLPGRQQLATRGASVRMAINPGEVWESYKAVVAASTEYKAMPSVDSALALCRVAATSREADVPAVARLGACGHPLILAHHEGSVKSSLRHVRVLLWAGIVPSSNHPTPSVPRH